MIRFLAQRLLRALLVLLGVSVLAFILIDLGIALIPIFLLYNALADAPHGALQTLTVSADH